MSTIKKYYRICLFGALLLLFSTGLFAEDRAVPTTYSAFLDAVNVPYAWNLGFTGAKAIVGIIDDSSDMNHPFFGSNIDTSLAFNTGVIYNDESYRQIYPDLPTQSANDTSAVWDRAVVRKDETLQPYNDYGDFHGTNVTGCIASYDTTTNTYGPAYGATLVPIRVDFPCQDFDVYMPDGTRISKYTTVQAIKYRNDVIDVKNNSYGSAAGYVGTDSDAFKAGIADARANNTIMMYSSGNERDDRFFPDAKDCAKKIYTGHPYTIAVAATGRNETADYTAIAPFSDYGSCVFICAPGVDIQTSDRDDYQTGNIFLYEKELVSTSEVQGVSPGNVCSTFTGTSASCPVATGVVALAIDAYKTTYPGQVCDTRFIKHLLTRTSTKIDLEATDQYTAWTTNAASFSFLPSYGFGQINAKGLIDAILDPETTLGGQFNSVTPQTIATLNWSNMEVSPEEVLIYHHSYPSFNDSGNAWHLTKYSTSENGILSAAAENQTDLAYYVTLSEDQPLAADSSQLVYTQTQTITADIFQNAGIAKQSLEEVVLTLTVTANDLEEGFDARFLEIVLDHNGYESTLAHTDKRSLYDYFDEITWSFSSNAFWGEDPTGDWTLNVYNTGSEETFHVSDVYSTFYMGTLSYFDANAVPEPASWALMIFGAFGLVYLRKRG